MLASINNQNHTNFTARLNLKNVQHNLDQWTQANKILEEKTSKIPYILNVDEYQDGASIYALTKDGHEHCLGLSDKCLQTLASMTPEKMADKLAKLVKLFAKEDAENSKIIKFLNHLEKSKSAPDNLFIDNYANFAEIYAKDTQLALQKDKVFRNSEYLI